MSKKKFAWYIFFSLLIAYVLTGVLILCASWLAYKMSLSDRAIGFMVMFIYIFTNVIAGLFIGHHAEKKQYLWGMLSGLCYCIILLMISLIATGGVSHILSDGLLSVLLCAGGGMLGGMIS